MKKLSHFLRILAFPAFIVLLVAVLTVMNQSALHARCVDTRDGREQGNVRADVLRQFLASAAIARQRAADAADNSNEREFNQQAADQYRKLLIMVKDVPLPKC